ncbi:MAG: nucleotidyl transferase AbiEii/AbiGii toxin family protein [Ginsengibacter sp.]
MSTYKLTYERLRHDPSIGNMLSALEAAFEKFGIDFYLVGASARDAWISGIHLKNPGRATKDIDIAIVVNDKVQFQQLKDYLTTEEKFQPIKENAFVLIYDGMLQLDLLPFGSIEDEDRRVHVDGSGYTKIDVPGFAEVFEAGLPEMELENGNRFKFCTLPGIALLKLLAWEDRPEGRTKDILDISEILDHFFSINDREIWEHHSDLFADEDVDLTEIGARVLGRQMRKIAIKNGSLYKRIDQLLLINIKAAEASKMAAIMTGYFKNSLMANVRLLEAMKQGFSDE